MSPPDLASILAQLGANRDEWLRRLDELAGRYPEAAAFLGSVRAWLADQASDAAIGALPAQVAAEFRDLLARGVGPVTHSDVDLV